MDVMTKLGKGPRTAGKAVDELRYYKGVDSSMILVTDLLSLETAGSPYIQWIAHLQGGFRTQVQTPMDNKSHSMSVA